jgi:hypothetical protein
MRLINVLGLLAALLVSFGAGAFTAGMRHWFQPIATVHIKNQSGLAVTSLVITSRTGNSTTITQLGSLAADAEATARVFMAGEGSYQVRAMLSNGRILDGGAGYVESGYTSTELLHPDRIESRSSFGL